MKKEEMRIVYMGTPHFAVAPLKALVEQGFNVVGVITMPDKPQGRHGSVLQPSPVKEFAVSAGIPVLQPERLKDEAFLDELRTLKADLQIVVAFRMLPQVVWSMPRLGTFNLHGSLLPQYRGAAPINWAIINGEAKTGVTTFFLKHEIDTGDIIHRMETPITDTDNAETLHDRLMEMGAELVVRTTQEILDNAVTPIPQDDIPERELRLAPKIFKETCRIDWNKSAVEVWNFVRGLSPYPASWTTLQTPSGESLDCKIYSVRVAHGTSDRPYGSIDTDGRLYIKVHTACGIIEILELQLAGKKRMAVQAFLNGFNLTDDHFVC